MFKTFMKLIPFLVSMMALAEKAFDGKPKSGADKKAMVLDATKVVVDGITDLGPEKANELDKPINDFIDVSAKLIFNKTVTSSNPLEIGAFPHPRL